MLPGARMTANKASVFHSKIFKIKALYFVNMINMFCIDKQKCHN